MNGRDENLLADQGGEVVAEPALQFCGLGSAGFPRWLAEHTCDTTPLSAGCVGSSAEWSGHQVQVQVAVEEPAEAGGFLFYRPVGAPSLVEPAHSQLVTS